jgi:hypothetical protein
MKPRSFTYLRPASLDEALQALGQYREDARIIAGGLSLVPMMNFRLIEAKALIDISGLASLAYIRENGGEIEIGAATPQSDVLAWPKLATVVPLLSVAMPHIGHFQTRSRAPSYRFVSLRLAAASCCNRRAASGYCRQVSSRPACCLPPVSRTRWWSRSAFRRESKARAMPSPR